MKKEDSKKGFNDGAVLSDEPPPASFDDVNPLNRSADETASILNKISTFANYNNNHSMLNYSFMESEDKNQETPKLPGNEKETVQSDDEDGDCARGRPAIDQ